MSDLFYIFGIGLTVMALVVAFAGIRMEGFPSRPVFIGGLALMTFLVVGSAAFAVVLSREEHEVREVEIAEFREEEEAELQETAGEPQGDEEEAEQVETEPEASQELDLTSPEPGDLVFEPETLESEAGAVTLNYTNPSEVPHNVAIEDDEETLVQGETVTGGDAGPATTSLDPGEYVYYCSIPGHREQGMEGTLTVK